MATDYYRHTNLSQPYQLSSVNDSASSEWNYDDYIQEIYDQTRRRVYPEIHEYFLIAIYIIIFFVAIMGNTMVCIAILKNDHMRTVTNYYIMNLATTDILIAFVCLPITITVDVSESWFFGRTACYLIPYFQLVLVCASIYTLMMIAVDRYLAICHPLKFQIRASRTLLTIALVWVVSFFIALPVAVVNDLEPQAASVHIGKPLWRMSCAENRWVGKVWEKLYHTAFFLAVYIVPLTVIGVAYTRVCRRLWSGIPTEEGCGASKPSFNQANVVSTTTISKSTEAQLKSRRKVASMLIVVVIAFAICFFPFQLLNVLKKHNAFGNLRDASAQYNAVYIPYIIGHLMAFINSAINPIIYNFMSAKFRQAFKSMFDCFPCCQSPRRSQAIDGTSGPAYRRANSTGVSDTHTTEYVPMTSIRNGRGVNNNISAMSKGV
nr:orexin receptor type 2-like [Lytechinus pictus]